MYIRYNGYYRILVSVQCIQYIIQCIVHGMCKTIGYVDFEESYTGRKRIITGHLISRPKFKYEMSILMEVGTCTSLNAVYTHCELYICRYIQIHTYIYICIHLHAQHIYITHCTIRILQHIINIEHDTYNSDTVLCNVYNIHCILYTVHCTLCTLCTVHCVHCTLFWYYIICCDCYII